jgi:hypothetical protein
VKVELKRRDFIKTSGLTVLAAVISARILGRSVPAFAADAPLEMVKESDPMAQSLGYKADAKKVDIKKFPKRAGADGAKQFCHTCQFFQAKDPKTAKTAACTIFQNKGVQANGWCNTWTLNPKA